MAIPDYETLMLPVLETIADGRVYRKREVDENLAERFMLTEEEKQQTVASGSNLFASRVHWAVTYILNANLVRRPARAHVQITDRGKQVVKSGSKHVNNKFLYQFPEFQEWMHRTRQQSARRQRDNTQNATQKPNAAQAEFTLTPEEQIDSSFHEIVDNLATELLSRIQSCTPGFFEHLVIRLLTRMGYGGSLPEAGQVIGKSGDGGIDGLIKEDKLGLDVIYVQAKRWEVSVSAGSVRDFSGSLDYHGAKKGVFITTSSFTRDAKDFVTKLGEKKIVLIDGFELARLMIEHDVGVTTVNTYAIKRVDSDYFEEE